jgi:hypothetical protein
LHPDDHAILPLKPILCDWMKHSWKINRIIFEKGQTTQNGQKKRKGQTTI